MNMYQDEYNPIKVKALHNRIESLIESDHYIEAVILLSAMIEFHLRLCVLDYGKWIKFLLESKKISFNINDYINKKSNRTLGDYISLFSIYCSDDNLIRNLKQFNSLRNDCVHKILSSGKELDDFNKSIKKNIWRWWQLLLDITDISTSILKKQNRRYKNLLKKTKELLSEGS